MDIKATSPSSSFLERGEQSPADRFDGCESQKLASVIHPSPEHSLSHGTNTSLNRARGALPPSRRRCCLIRVCRGLLQEGRIGEGSWNGSRGDDGEGRRGRFGLEEEGGREGSKDWLVAVLKIGMQRSFPREKTKELTRPPPEPFAPLPNPALILNLLSSPNPSATPPPPPEPEFGPLTTLEIGAIIPNVVVEVLVEGGRGVNEVEELGEGGMTMAEEVEVEVAEVVEARRWEEAAIASAEEDLFTAAWGGEVPRRKGEAIGAEEEGVMVVPDEDEEEDD